jgi:hypothetical protein
MSTFVFFHVGDDLTWPNKLVSSLKQTNPDVKIVMASDPGTPDLDGVDRRVNIKGDRQHIMLMRLAGFVGAQVEEPAMYLDTDMIVLEKIDPAQILGNKTAMMCRRSFNKDDIFNHGMRGIDFSEYKGRTLDQVYPILACATITRDWKPWAQMTAMIDFIDPKFKLWYGDQEVLRLYSKTEEDDVGYINESEYACLPEYQGAVTTAPKIIHYKGSRK